MKFTKINPLALGISVSILAGLATFFIGIGAIIFFGNRPIVAMIDNIYLSYIPSFTNASVGAALVLIGTFCIIYLVTWIYNLLLDYI